MWPLLRPVQSDQQFHERGLPRPGWSDEGDGLAAIDVERNLLQRRLATPTDAGKRHRRNASCLEAVDGHRVLRARLRRQAQDGFEILQRDLGFAVDVDHISQFLQRSENEERIDEQREELPDGDPLREDQVQHQEQDRGPQQVDECALDEAQAAQVAHLLQFQLQDLGGGGVQPLDLLLRQAEALHQFDIAQRFGGGAGQRRRLAARCVFCTSLILRLSTELSPPSSGTVSRYAGATDQCTRQRVDHHEDHADQRGEDQIDRHVDQLLHVGSDLLQFAQRLAAALVFEQRVGQFQRVPDAVGIDARADLLGDQVDEVVLEILGDARDERDAHGRRQQHADAADELRAGVFAVSGGVGVDDVAEDQRVEQREHLIDGRQHERRGDQLPVIPQISVENAHLFTVRYPRPMSGIVVAITVMNCTFASSGRFAMYTTASAT